MFYSLAPLCYPDSTRRKTTKSKLFEAAINDMHVVQGTLPDRRILHKYFIDLAASVRTVISNCEIIRDISHAILSSIPEQFDEIFIASDSYQQSSIKNSVRISRGYGERYVLKSPDMCW